MSDAKRTPADPAEAPPQRKAAGQPEIEFKPPLKPRPALAVVLGILLVLWLAALIIMRLKTIHSSTAPAAPSGIESPK
jgi:hypothetical protein